MLDAAHSVVTALHCSAVLTGYWQHGFARRAKMRVFAAHKNLQQRWPQNVWSGVSSGGFKS